MKPHVTGPWIVAAGVLVFLNGCGPAIERATPAPATSECRILEESNCTLERADIVVEMEIVIHEDGVGTVERILNVKPPDHPLRDRAIEQASKPGVFAARGAATTHVRRFPFCEHPTYTTYRFGACKE